MTAHSTKLLLELLKQDLEAGLHKHVDSIDGKKKQEAKKEVAQVKQEIAPKVEAKQEKVSSQKQDVKSFVQGTLSQKSQGIEDKMKSNLDAKFRKGNK